MTSKATFLRWSEILTGGPHLGKLACIVIVRLDARGVRGDGTPRNWANGLYARGLHWHWTISPCATMYTRARHSVGKVCGIMCWKNVELLLLGKSWVT